MDIIKELSDQVVVLKLKGNILSGVDANLIHQLIHEELELKHLHFVLDMSEVGLINSSGIGILISSLTAARNQKGDIVLAAVSEKVNHVLWMMRLNRVFGLYETVDQAKQKFLMEN